MKSLLTPMPRRFLPRFLAAAFLLLSLTGTAGLAADGGTLRAGAAKLDITPAPDFALPFGGYGNRAGNAKGVHDALHVRAIVVDDGATQAALVSVDIVGISDALCEKMTARLNRETQIAKENIFLMATSTHAAPAIEGVVGEMAPKSAAYAARLEDALVAVVQTAKTNLQSAKIGFGTGRANVNINRRARTANGGWGLGYNPDGVSDKTVAVVKFETTAGVPLAILSNYAVHSTVMGPGNFEISSDLGGATASYVEEHYGDKVVAPWTVGATGDQAPIYDRNGTQFSHVAILGQILGEEVVRVADQIKTSARGHVRVLQKVVSCPGKRTTQSPAPGKPYTFVDTDPVPVRLSLLTINDIAFAGISGNVFTKISQRVKAEGSFNHALVITLCNGSSGYLPDDAAYEQVSYEISSARVKPGYVENAIVSGFVEMMSTLF